MKTFLTILCLLVFIIEKRLKTNSLTVLDADSLKRLFREYNVKNNNITELKNRVDIIPISLAIAQAAIESGWGTSRFALEGNAFFGQKIIGSNVNGIKPIKNQNPYIKVRTFNTLKDSVNAYAKSLNTHKAYQTFRQVRKEKRSLSQALEGSNLVNTLRKYSELGEEYTEQVQSIIEKNNLEKLKKERNTEKVNAALNALTKGCERKDKNLLSLAVEAAKQRATLGEISDALGKVFGRYKAQNPLITGVYKMEIQDDKYFKKAQELADKFAIEKGRRPRIMVAKMGQDGHDRGAKIVATSFADLGFDVDISPLFQTPEEVAKQAIENDVHILGISSLAAGHKTLLPKVITALKKLGRKDILVIAGGVIPKQDHDFLYKAGVSGVFGPGTIIAKSAIAILEKLN